MSDDATAGPRPPLRAVAFDLDGLMFDTEALFVRVASDMLAARGKPLTRAILDAMIGRQWAVAGPAFKEIAGLEESVEELRREKVDRYEALIDTTVHPTPGLFALLAQLERRGLPRAVATSSHRAYTERLLRRHDLMDHFAFLLTAEDITRSKPDPEIYRTAAGRFGIEPAALLVLEDSVAGVSAARGAGAFVVAVPHEHSPADRLGHAHRIVERLDDPRLIELLGPQSSGP